MRSKRFWIALFIFSLIGQIAWVVENMYFNVFIYHMFNASQGDIALMVQASAVAATVTTLFIGALSDRLGKRKAFITVGYILWGISILAFAALRIDWMDREALSCRCAGRRKSRFDRRDARHRLRLHHDVFRLDRKRRMLQRMAHGQHRRNEPRQS